MFPALTSEFMKAENDYRYSRNQRSFLEHGDRGGRTRRTLHRLPSVGRDLP